MLSQARREMQRRLDTVKLNEERARNGDTVFDPREQLDEETKSNIRLRHVRNVLDNRSLDLLQPESYTQPSLIHRPGDFRHQQENKQTMASATVNFSSCDSQIVPEGFRSPVCHKQEQQKSEICDSFSCVDCFTRTPVNLAASACTCTRCRVRCATHQLFIRHTTAV